MQELSSNFILACAESVMKRRKVGFVMPALRMFMHILKGYDWLPESSTAAWLA